MPQVRSIVRPNVRSLIRGNTAGIYGATSYHDGISYNAETGRVVVKAVGGAPSIGTLTSLFTFTGGNQSMYRASNGLLVASATNTPRIEYDAGGSCLGLLMEAARTNIALQSQAFGAAEWTTTQASVTSNTATAPDGTATADKIIEDSSTNVHGLRVTTDITITSNATCSLSIFAKAAERSALSLKLADATDSNGVFGTFDLAAVTATPASYGTGSGAVASITPYADGWYRCVISGAINNSATASRVRIRIFNGAESYAGNGSSGILLWGVQFENGASFPSSYIPTTTTSVARTADVCTRTLGSEFSATAGTVVVRGRASGGQDAAVRQPVFAFDDGTANNRIPVLRNAATDNCQLRIDTGGVNQTAILGTFSNSTNFKMATAWAANDAALVFNGGTVQTDASVTLPTVTGMGLGYEPGSTTQMNGHIRTFDYYPTRQTNAFLVTAST